MGMMINCSKGCGEAIAVSDEMIEEARSLGKPLAVQHEVCHNEPGAVKRTFKVVTQVIEVHPAEEEGQDDSEELLASMGGTVEATSFKQALGMIGNTLDAHWSRINGLADVVDQPENPA